jgi:hypothetical protein
MSIPIGISLRRQEVRANHTSAVAPAMFGNRSFVSSGVTEDWEGLDTPPRRTSGQPVNPSLRARLSTNDLPNYSPIRKRPSGRREKLAIRAPSHGIDHFVEPLGKLGRTFTR